MSERSERVRYRIEHGDKIRIHKRTFPIIFRKSPKMFDDFRRLPKVAEYFRAIFEDVSIDHIERNLGPFNN